MNCSPNVVETVIIENGSSMTRVGLAGDSKPRFCFPTNDPRMYDLDQSITKKDFLPQTSRKSKIVEKGIIVNWDGIALNWRFIFNNLLHVDSKKSPVLLLEPPLDPWSNREKIAKIMFEQFEVPALCLKPGPELLLHQSGRETGLVMTFDLNNIYFVPILEKQSMPHLVRNFVGELESITAQNIPLRLVEEIFNAIMQIESLLHGGIEFRKQCVQNIIIAGEISSISDVAISLQDALIQQDSRRGSTGKLDFHITHPLDPKNSAWIAGAKYVLQPDFSSKWVTLQDYQSKI